MYTSCFNPSTRRSLTLQKPISPISSAVYLAHFVTAAVYTHSQTYGPMSSSFAVQTWFEVEMFFLVQYKLSVIVIAGITAD